MANNFFLSQDPLLYQSTLPRQYETEEDLRKQMNDTFIKYKMMQQQKQQDQDNLLTDHLNDLDKMIKSLNSEVVETLSNDEEYARLSNELRDLIQTEMISNIKWKINSNPIAVKNMERQKEIIDKANRAIENEHRQNLNELNDYVKNYSDITFDEYKRIKNGGNSEPPKHGNKNKVAKQMNKQNESK